MEQTRNRTGLVLGAILIVVGILSLFGQFLDIQIGGFAWPFIIIAAGAAFFVAMVLGGRALAPLAIPGSIISTVGLILFYQNLTGNWETWSYVWGLIISAVGIGMFIAGLWGQQEDLRQRGGQLVRLGVILFLVFGAIFEFVFSFVGSSSRGSGILWPIILLLVGVYLLITRAYTMMQSPEQRVGRDLNLFWPVMFIGFSALWILVNLGWLEGSRVVNLFSLWPLLLIAAGVDLLFGRRIPWVGGLVGAGIVAVLFYVTLSGMQLGSYRTTGWFMPFTLGSDQAFISERVNGSGNLMSETRSIQGVRRISLESVGDAEIVQGDTEGLVIETDDNLLPYITSQVKGNQLVIGVKRGVSIQPKSGLRYTITVKDLTQVESSGVTTVSIGKLVTGNLTISSSGMGTFNLGNLQADDLEVDISGSGTASVGGEADELEVRISGAGTFDAPNLQTQNAQVDISGLGKANLWVTQSLRSNISGLGSVNYYGSPSVSQTNSGAGSVHHIGDK